MSEDPFPRAIFAATSFVLLDLVDDLDRRFAQEESRKRPGANFPTRRIPRETLRSVVPNGFLKMETAQDAKLFP